MSKTTGLLVCGFALTLAGCIPLSVREHFNQRGLGAAAFQLQCPPEQIQVVSLNRPIDDGIYPGDQVDVSGWRSPRRVHGDDARHVDPQRARGERPADRRALRSAAGGPASAGRAAAAGRAPAGRAPAPLITARGSGGVATARRYGSTAMPTSSRRAWFASDT